VINAFIAPYVQMFYGAAYNVQQSLEGYGLSSSNFIELDDSGGIVGSYWSPAQASLVPAFLITAYFVFVLLPLVLSAGYILNRKAGALFSLVVLLLPGVLNVIGWWPGVSFVPEKFTISGTGVMGDIFGYIPLLIIGLISGWCMTVIIYDSFLLSDKFRNIYDHLWYCSAIAAGLFFISDSNINKHKQDLIEENEFSQQASAYLAKQLRSYYRFCVENGTVDSVSCSWASDVQQTLTDYVYSAPVIFVEFGPTDTSDIYFPFSRDYKPKDALKIREEIRRFNNSMCPVRALSSNTRQYSKSSTVCERIPANFCRTFPEPPEGFIDESIGLQTVALASECIVPTLVRSRLIQEKLLTKVHSDSRRSHLRWLYFLLFSLVVGGKIANATTKLASLDSRPADDRRRLAKLVMRVFRCGMEVVRAFMRWNFCQLQRLTPSWRYAVKRLEAVWKINA